MAILGLLIEKPDSVAGLASRLEEEYPTAGWQRNILHNTLPSLTEKGLVDRREDGPAAWHRCEVTTAGRDVFAGWLKQSSAAPPRMRDPLMAKLKHVREPEQLAVAVRDIAAREQMTLRAYDAAVSRYRRAHAAGELSTGPDGDSRARIRGAALTFELRELQARIKNLQRVREDLEDPEGLGDALEDV
jgi:DNA-binding transcriptional ArsR family regulator